MSGTVTWEVLIWVASIILASAGAAAIVLGWAYRELGKRDDAIIAVRTEAATVASKLRNEANLAIEAVEAW